MASNNKTPYFENKVPGLECTLPASAVLEATTALKASTLLPLNVPIGKPILSCNATKLLQAQISLDGIIYDCSDFEITLSCPRLDENKHVVDECYGDTMVCDVKTSTRISCTNGTLISNQPIVCKTATLMAKKNILNCFFKNRLSFESPNPKRLPHSSVKPTVELSQVYLPPLSSEEDSFEGASSISVLHGSNSFNARSSQKILLNTKAWKKQSGL